MRIGKAGIILRRDRDEAREMAREMAGWLAGRGVEALVDRIEPDMDLLVVLGGDGTLLHVAGEASRFDIPVLGVNLGDLGFLAEVEADDRMAALDDLLAGSLAVEERMMLAARVSGPDGEGEWRPALNDVVVSRGSLDRLPVLSVRADDELITDYRADGLVVATPTGSTAYNLSAGGPIVRPDLDTILVTPICPFMLETRPVLLPPKVRLVIETSGRAGGELGVIIDGQAAERNLAPGRRLEVRTADKRLKLVTSPRRGYFEILRSKLNWGGNCNGG